MMIAPHHRIRILFIAFLLLAGMAALGYRLYTLQVVRHEELSQAVNRLHERRVRLPAIRGTILDCHGNILAHSVIVHTVIADPQTIRKADAQQDKNRSQSRHDEWVRILNEQLALPRNEVKQKLSRSGHYVILKHKVSEETTLRLQAILKQRRLRGVIFEDDQVRVYPNGSLMSHVLGFVNSEQRGMSGVELVMQNDLQGQDGWRRIECDSRGMEIMVYRSEDFSSRQGYTVVLTLDQVIQNIVEQELDRALQKYQPDSATMIVTRPSTGEVLALVNYPTFDPNKIGEQIEALRNRAIADQYEPGSIFKIVTVATALDYRIVGLRDIIWCENGRFFYGGRYLNDSEPYGNLTVTEVLEHSSNIGAAKIALLLGNDRMYRTMRNFGFGERAFGNQRGEYWPEESRGTVHPLQNWSKVSITRVAMGHEIAATPLQIIMAMSALANGGNLMYPQIVKRVIDQNGNTIREFFPHVRCRVVDQRAAQEVTEALKQVVSKEGTAAKAAIPGFVVAGKTGTSQKLVNNQYSHNQYIASFCGYFPADNPEVCIYAMLDNPKSQVKYGGAVAAPIFHDVAVRVASYLDLKPSFEAIASMPATSQVIPVARQINQEALP